MHRDVVFVTTAKQLGIGTERPPTTEPTTARQVEHNPTTSAPAPARPVKPATTPSEEPKDPFDPDIFNKQMHPQPTGEKEK